MEPKTLLTRIRVRILMMHSQIDLKLDYPLVNSLFQLSMQIKTNLSTSSAKKRTSSKRRLSQCWSKWIPCRYNRFSTRAMQQVTKIPSCSSTRLSHAGISVNRAFLPINRQSTFLSLRMLQLSKTSAKIS